MARVGEARVLVDGRLGAVAVDPDRAAVDDALDSGVARGLEDRRGGAGVGALGADRVGLHVADVRHGRQVDDGLAAGHGFLESAGVGGVAEDGFDHPVPVVPRAAEVEDARLVALTGQDVDDVRADEAGAARDEHARPGAIRAGVVSGLSQ